MTEKDYNPERRNKKATVGNPKQQTATPKIKHEVEKKDKIKEETKAEEVVAEEKQTEISEQKSEDKHKTKKPIQTKPKEKKFDAVVNASGLPISTKKSVDMCRAINGKKIDVAINYLEKVISKKKALQMKGEYPHQKGIMSGRFPKKTAEHFIILLKSLQANANVNEIEEPIITEAIANMASKPYAKFGRWRKKRTHVKLVARSKIKNSDGDKK